MWGFPSKERRTRRCRSSSRQLYTIACRSIRGADPFRRRPPLLDSEQVGEVGSHVERDRRRLVDRAVVADLDQFLQPTLQASPADHHQAGAGVLARGQRAQHERRGVSALRFAGERLQHAAVDAQRQQAQGPQIGEVEAVGAARDVAAALAEAERLAVDERDGTAGQVGRHGLVVRVPGVLDQRHRSCCSWGDGALARRTWWSWRRSGAAIGRSIASVVAGADPESDALDVWCPAGSPCRPPPEPAGCQHATERPGVGVVVRRDGAQVVVDVVLGLEVLGHNGGQPRVEGGFDVLRRSGSCTRHTTIGTMQASHSAIQHSSSS